MARPGRRVTIPENSDLDRGEGAAGQRINYDNFCPRCFDTTAVYRSAAGRSPDPILKKWARMVPVCRRAIPDGGPPVGQSLSINAGHTRHGTKPSG